MSRTRALALAAMVFSLSVSSVSTAARSAAPARLRQPISSHRELIARVFDEAHHASLRAARRAGDARTAPRRDGADDAMRDSAQEYGAAATLYQAGSIMAETAARDASGHDRTELAALGSLGRHAAAHHNQAKTWATELSYEYDRSEANPSFGEVDPAAHAADSASHLVQHASRADSVLGAARDFERRVQSRLESASAGHASGPDVEHLRATVGHIRTVVARVVDRAAQSK
jgi:hypothetical protein